MSPEPSSSTPKDDLIGKELGQYTIERQLGRGGMASVYLADQVSIGRQVAVKVMPRHFLHDPSFLERFQREVKVIANLQHPRVLPVYDYGQIDERPYIVMAYMPGGTLSDKIEKGGMTLAETAKVIRQVAEGLDHAHRKGIIHRDFKPSNVLMSEYGDAVLADFGIAKLSESTVNLTGSGVIGTPSYMAPEMAERGEVTSAVDIYALGVTLFEMLTGSAPFHGETPLSVMMAHATRPVPDVLITRPDVPKAVADVIKKSMSKRPEDRYPTAMALSKALDEAISGAPKSGKAPKPPKTLQMEAAPSPVNVTVPEAAEAQSTGSAGIHEEPTSSQEKSGSGLLRVFGGIGVGALAIIFLCIAVTGAGIVLLVVSGSNTTDDGPIVDDSTDSDSVSGNPDGQAVDESGPSVIVSNQSSQAVCAVYYLQVDVNDPAWSGNLLGSGQQVEVGAETTLGGVPVGTHWFRAEFCDANTFNDYNFDVDLSENASHTFVVEGNIDSTLTVINDSPFEICFLYFVEPGQDLRGDQFGLAQTLPANSTVSIGMESGSYDLRAETCDQNTTWDLANTAISSEFEWTLTE